jgi:hypothetical protein
LPLRRAFRKLIAMGAAETPVVDHPRPHRRRRIGRAVSNGWDDRGLRQIRAPDNQSLKHLADELYFWGDWTWSVPACCWRKRAKSTTARALSSGNPSTMPINSWAAELMVKD